MKKEITLEGMKCEGCANAVKARLSSVPGVSEAVVNLENQSALIQSDGTVDDNELSESLSDTNYSVVGIKEIDA